MSTISPPRVDDSFTLDVWEPAPPPSVRRRTRVERLLARAGYRSQLGPACAAVAPRGTAVLYLWNLGVSGWANSYYSAAVQAGTKSWKAFFFGSTDASNFVTVDKTPVVAVGRWRSRPGSSA